MANQCENVLSVYGEYAELLNFDSKFRGGKENIEENYHFDNLYPTSDLPISNACDWRKEHWGVKGNFYEPTLKRDMVNPKFKEVNYYFTTPNTGPERLIEKVSKDFPKLTFVLAYRELGNDIRQIQSYEAGKLTSDERLSYEDMMYWFGEDEGIEKSA